jgi:hypothetical protein
MKAATPAVVLGIGLLIFVHATGAQPAIYRCDGAGGVVYTDRPCESGANPHEVDDSRVSVYTPSPVTPRASASTPTKQPKSKRAKTGRAVDPAEQQAKCAKLKEGLRDVRSKMRSGYGAKEGERLKERQRQLNERRRAQKCG